MKISSINVQIYVCKHQKSETSLKLRKETSVIHPGGLIHLSQTVFGRIVGVCPQSNPDPALRRKTPHSFAGLILENRLFQRVRSELGLCYSIYFQASVTPDYDVGWSMVTANSFADDRRVNAMVLAIVEVMLGLVDTLTLVCCSPAPSPQSPRPLCI